MIRSARVTVAQVAVELTVEDKGPDIGSTIVVQAPASASLFLGGEDLTLANGFELPAGERVAIDLQTRDRLYGLQQTGSANISVMRTGI